MRRMKLEKSFIAVANATRPGAFVSRFVPVVARTKAVSPNERAPLSSLLYNRIMGKMRLLSESFSDTCDHEKLS